MGIPVYIIVMLYSFHRDGIIRRFQRNS